MPQQYKRINITLTTVLHQKLEAVANRIRQSKTEIVTKLISDYIVQVEQYNEEVKQYNKEMADYRCPVTYTSEFFQEIQFFGVEDTFPPDASQLK